MSKILNETVLKCVTASGLVDNDQRSALGMARTWLDQGEMKLAIPGLEAPCRGRDDLAKALVEAIRDENRDDAIKALAHARRVINEPSVDESMAGFRAERLKRGEIEVAKKGGKKEPAKGQ